MDYLMAHEAFHVLTRADSALREELYLAIGFRACETTELRPCSPSSASRTPTRPKSAAIRLTRGEVIPFVHFAPEPIDVTKGLGVHARTSWLPVDRHDGGYRARDERLTTDSLEGLYEQVGRNTEYLIHPEEILADNFALLFRAPAKLRRGTGPYPSGSCVASAACRLLRGV